MTRKAGLRSAHRARWRPQGGARPAVLSAALLALTVLAEPAAAQQQAARFFVDSVADSTFVFRTGGARWIRHGLTGIAVDPRDRDALVARFRVLQVSDQSATALITGQTTFLTSDHVALIAEPPVPFWRRGLFWKGSLLGAVLGLVAGASF